MTMADLMDDEAEMALIAPLDEMLNHRGGKHTPAVGDEELLDIVNEIAAATALVRAAPVDKAVANTLKILANRGYTLTRPND